MVSEKQIFSYLNSIGVEKSDVVQWSGTFQNEIIGYDIEVKLKNGRYLHINEGTIVHYSNELSYRYRELDLQLGEIIDDILKYGYQDTLQRELLEVRNKLLNMRICKECGKEF